MGTKIDLEDSAQHLILANFFERTKGEFVLITDQLVDGLGYRCRVMPKSLSGIVAEAGAKNPLKAERVAIVRALEEWDDIQTQLKAAAEAMGFTEDD